MKNREYEQKFKFCPQCKKGIKFKDNQLKCNSCNFTYYINSVAAVAAIIPNELGQILFIKRAKEPSKGRLALPGGFINLGEDPEVALKRELKEEINIKIGKMKFLTAASNEYPFEGITYSTTVLIYVCDVKSVNLNKLMKTDECSDILFIDPIELNEKDLAFKSVKTGIQKYINKRMA